MLVGLSNLKITASKIKNESCITSDSILIIV